MGWRKRTEAPSLKRLVRELPAREREEAPKHRQASEQRLGVGLNTQIPGY